MRAKITVAALLAAILISTGLARATALSTITGNLSDLYGAAAANARVTFDTTNIGAQNGSNSNPQIIVPSKQTVYADANGNLPTGAGCQPTPGAAVCLIQGEMVDVTFGLHQPGGSFYSSQPIRVQVQLMNTQDLVTLIIANTDPPSLVSQLAVAAGGDFTLGVVNPATGSVGTATLTPGTVTAIQGTPICPGTPANPNALIYNGTNWCGSNTFSILQGDLLGDVDPCAHGFGCGTAGEQAQFDTGVTVTNGSPTITISQNKSGAFSATQSVGQCIKIIDATTLQDQYVGTIATYHSPTSVDIAVNYPGTTQVTADTAVWGQCDGAKWTAMMNYIGTPNTAGIWWPRRIKCHAPIIADTELEIGPAYNVELEGTGDSASMNTSVFANENQNGCLLIDMNPNLGTMSTDILQLQGNMSARIHDIAFDGSQKYPKRGLIGISQSAGRTSVQNRVWNVANNLQTPTQSSTWGLVPCAVTGNISGSTITCNSPPTGLNPNQYVYIFDSTVGPERKISAGVAGSIITLTTPLKATHTAGQFQVMYDQNIFALAGIYVDSQASQTDTNSFQNNAFQRVDTGIDIRQIQAVSSSIDTLVCTADATCIGINGAAGTVRNVQQNDTSIGWVLDTDATMNCTSFAAQPGTTGSTGIPAGTSMFGFCNGSGGFPSCWLDCQDVFWFSGSANLANGAMIQTSPGVQKGYFHIEHLHLAPSVTAAPANAQISPSIQLFMNGVQQSFDTIVDYDLGASAAGLNFFYQETGSPYVGAYRHVKICPATSAILGLPPQCTDEVLLGSDTYERYRTDIAGHLRTAYATTPFLPEPAAPLLACKGGTTGTTWQYGATVCADPQCKDETDLANTATISCEATADSTHFVTAQVTTPVLAARVRLYRCPGSGTCATSAMTFQYVHDVGDSDETGPNGGQTPGKTGFVDYQAGVNWGNPPPFNMTGQAKADGLVSAGGLALATPLPTPGTQPTAILGTTGGGGPSSAVMAKWVPIIGPDGNQYMIPAWPGAPTQTPTPTPTAVATPTPTATPTQMWPTPTPAPT